MVITLTGKNTFMLLRELSRVVLEFTDKYGDLAVERIDCEEAELPQIEESLGSLPFLANKKLVVLRDPSANKTLTEQIELIISNLPDTTELILVESKVDKRQAYYKYIKKVTDFREFKELDPVGLANWLSQEAKANEAKLSFPDAKYLVDRAGTNQQLLANELEKLILYNPDITRSSIDLLVEPTPQSTIFQLLDLAFSGQVGKAIEMYQEQRAMKVEPMQIIAMISWQLKMIAVAKAAGSKSSEQIARETKYSPFTITKSQKVAKRMPMNNIKRHTRNLLEIDKKSKSFSLDVDSALEQYILELAE